MRPLARLLSPLLVLAPLAGFGWACADDQRPGGGVSSGEATQPGFIDSPSLGVGAGLGGGSGSDSQGQSAFAGQACADGSITSRLDPLYLVFLLDQSGSMRDDPENEDSPQRWTPVTQAITGFVTDKASAGLHASLTLFPGDQNPGDALTDDKIPIQCEETDYDEPIVAPIELPDDSAFAKAIEKVSPPNEFGTPTLPALNGTISYAQSLIDDGHTAAIVLVTDGGPIGCEGNTVEASAAAAAAVVGEMFTYVIGVTDDPLDLQGLHDVAESGGTEEALIIDIESPEKTEEALLQQIIKITTRESPCEFSLPDPPEGKPFSATRVNVEFIQDGKASVLAFDADCGGGDGWHYDDEIDPQKIQLCPDTCDVIRTEAGAQVNVVFGCERQD